MKEAAKGPTGLHDQDKGPTSSQSAANEGGKADRAAPGQGLRRLWAWMPRLRQRVAALSRSPRAHAAMLGVSVIDGSVFPVPPFAILVPMVLTEPRKWLRYATTGTLASLLGGLLGYGLGLGALLLVQDAPGNFEQGLGALVGALSCATFIRWGAGLRSPWFWGGGLLFGAALGVFAVVGLSKLSVHLETPIVFAPLGIDTPIGEALTQNFWMLALLCSILPTPYKLVAVGSGFVGVGLPEFFLASIFGRSARFYGIAWAFAFFGERARRWIKF